MGQLIGTPEYMSPEQADPSSEGVDTRSDVYSLGAVLYELIAGTPPFGECGRETRSRARLLQALRESEAPRPGAALRARGEIEARRIAEARGLEPSRLVAQLEGELAWIPLKALRKEPAQRYQSAMELGADVRNYLEGMPLLAGPESIAYRLRKYARRNPLRSLAMVGLPLVDLYAAWDEAEPGKGYGDKAAEWKAKLDAANAASSTAPSTEKKEAAAAARVCLRAPAASSSHYVEPRRHA